MGSCSFKSSNDKEGVVMISEKLFNRLYAIGRGGFGKVWRVTRKGESNSNGFAMKEMAKARIITKKSVSSVMNELKLLAVLQSDFIVNVHFAF
jgi:serine/threonine protein kinase